MPKPPKTAQSVASKYELDEVDRALFKHKINIPAITNEDLGKLVGLNRRAVHDRIKRPAFQKAYAEWMAPPKDILEKKLARVARRYLELTESSDERVAERACRAVLMTWGLLKNRVDVTTDYPEPVVITLPSGEKVMMGLKPAIEKAIDIDTKKTGEN